MAPVWALMTTMPVGVFLEDLPVLQDCFQKGIGQQRLVHDRLHIGLQSRINLITAVINKSRRKRTADAALFEDRDDFRNRIFNKVRINGC